MARITSDKHGYTRSTYIEDWIIAKNFGSHNREKLFRTDTEMAEEFVRLAVNNRLRLGRCLLLFPHLVEGKTFQTTPKRKWLCWVVAGLLTAASISLLTMKNDVKESFMFLLWAPMISCYTTLMINQIWMYIKKDKLDDFLANLQECRPYLEVDCKFSTIYSILISLSQFLVDLGFWYEITFMRKNRDVRYSIIFFFFMVGLFLCIAMLEQFVLLLSLVRQQLLRTALLSDTDQDALIAAAIDLNKVFSPQILMIITIFFVTLLGKIYKTVIQGEISSIQFYIVLAVHSLPLWRIVSHCHYFVNEVEHLHNRTYRYLLTHEHKIDKRLEFHLGMKRKFVFSAGGMFNVDYQLLCVMVTTAASYIVVLLQFSNVKDQSAPDTTTVRAQPS